MVDPLGPSLAAKLGHSDRYIDLSGPVRDTDLLAVIDGLAVVSEAQLPVAPLSYDDVMTDVGEFDVNGEPP